MGLACILFRTGESGLEKADVTEALLMESERLTVKKVRWYPCK